MAGDRLPSDRLDRRGLLKALAAVGGLAVSGCDRLSNEPRFRSVLDAANSLTYRVQRLLIGADRLAPEYGEADISPAFRANGSTDPQDEKYLDLVGNHFADWRLKVHGLVEHELSLSLEALRALPARTQITRHDCVEGWSCIGTSRPQDQSPRKSVPSSSKAWARTGCIASNAQPGRLAPHCPYYRVSG